MSKLIDYMFRSLDSNPRLKTGSKELLERFSPALARQARAVLVRRRLTLPSGIAASKGSPSDETPSLMNDDWKIGNFVRYETPFENLWISKNIRPTGTYKVSFLVRTQFARVRLLGRAIKSIIGQDLDGVDCTIRILVLHDRVHNPSLVEKMQGFDKEMEQSNGGKPVTIEYIPCDGGHRSYLLNEGLDRIEDGFVGVLDDDDYLYPSHLRTLLAALDLTESSAAFAASDVLYVDGGRDESGEFQSGSVHYSLWWSVDKLQRQNTFPIQSVLARRADIGATRFSMDLDAMEDWHFWLELAQAVTFVGVPRRTSAYRTPAPGGAFWSERLEHHLRYRGACPV